MAAEAEVGGTLPQNPETPTTSTEPTEVAESLLRLVDLGSSAAVTEILAARGHRKPVVRAGIKLLIVRCRPAQLIQLIVISADLSDKSILNLTIDNLKPEQKEALRFEQRDALKELFLQQIRRCWRLEHGWPETLAFLKLMELFDPKIRIWLLNSLGECNLEDPGFGGDEQWAGLANLIHGNCDALPEDKRQKLFVAALQCARISSLCFALILWSWQPDTQSLSYATSIIDHNRLTSALEILWCRKSMEQHNLAIEVAKATRSRIRSKLAAAAPDNAPLSHPLDFLEIGSKKAGRVMSRLDNYYIIDLGHSVLARLFDSDTDWRAHGRRRHELEVDERLDVMVLFINDETREVFVGIKQLDFIGQRAGHERLQVGATLPVRISKSKLAKRIVVETSSGTRGYMVRADHLLECEALKVSASSGQAINVRLIGHDPNTFQPVFQYRQAPPKSNAAPAPTFPGQMTFREFKARLRDDCERPLESFSWRELNEKLRQLPFNKERIEVTSFGGGWQFKHAACGEGCFLKARVVYGMLKNNGLLPTA